MSETQQSLPVQTIRRPRCPRCGSTETIERRFVRRRIFRIGRLAGTVTVLMIFCLLLLSLSPGL